MTKQFYYRARENAEAAEILFDRNKLNASANRAYYAVFHAILALLFHQGYQPAIDHRNALSLFCNEFVNKKKYFPSSVKKAIYELQNARIDADYGAGVSKNIANICLKKAKDFVSLISKEFDYEDKS